MQASSAPSPGEDYTNLASTPRTRIAQFPKLGPLRTLRLPAGILRASPCRLAPRAGNDDMAAMYDFRIKTADKAEAWRQVAAAADALTEGEPDAVANMANVAALLFESLPDLNWAG